MNFNNLKTQIEITIRNINMLEDYNLLNKKLKLHIYTETVKSYAETDGMIKALEPLFYGNQEFDDLVNQYKKVKKDYQEKIEEKIKDEILNH